MSQFHFYGSKLSEEGSTRPIWGEEWFYLILKCGGIWQTPTAARCLCRSHEDRDERL